MYPLYQDIRERLGAPKWIDREGVPRYSDFTPQEAGEIYCNYVALLEVECQSCGKTFLCANAVAWIHVAIKAKNHALENTPEAMAPYVFGWGDAPWHTYNGSEVEFDGQCSGTTMSTDFRVLEYWHRKDHEWVKLDNPESYQVVLENGTSTAGAPSGGASYMPESECPKGSETLPLPTVEQGEGQS